MFRATFVVPILHLVPYPPQVILALTPVPQSLLLSVGHTLPSLPVALLMIILSVRSIPLCFLSLLVSLILYPTVSKRFVQVPDHQAPLQSSYQLLPAKSQLLLVTMGLASLRIRLTDTR